MLLGHEDDEQVLCHERLITPNESTKLHQTLEIVGNMSGWLSIGPTLFRRFRTSHLSAENIFSLNTNILTYQGGQYESISPAKLKNSKTKLNFKDCSPNRRQSIHTGRAVSASQPSNSTLEAIFIDKYRSRDSRLENREAESDSKKKIEN